LCFLLARAWLELQFCPCISFLFFSLTYTWLELQFCPCISFYHRVLYLWTHLVVICVTGFLIVLQGFRTLCHRVVMTCNTFGFELYLICITSLFHLCHRVLGLCVCGLSICTHGIPVLPSPYSLD
jgi:hypothetical protein